MASPQGGQIAIAMRLRNQLQSVYKMDPLRNEVQGRRVDFWGPVAVRTRAGERTGGGGTGAQCACAACGGARYARAIPTGLPNAGPGRLRVVSLPAFGLPGERRVGRALEKRAPAVRGAPCWAEGELLSPHPYPHPHLLGPSPSDRNRSGAGKCRGDVGRACGRRVRSDRGGCVHRRRSE